MGTDLVIAATATASNVEPDDLQILLSSPPGTYGIRELDSRRVLTPSSVALTHYGDGEFAFVRNDPAPGTLYEHSLRVRNKDTDFYLRSLLCSLAATAPLNITCGFRSLWPFFLASPAEPDTPRSLKLRLERTPIGFSPDRGDSVRVRITAYDATNMSAFIFGHQQRAFDAQGVLQEDFSFVTSPFDADTYPANDPDPDQTPSFYRKNYIDILVPSYDAADRVWAAVKTEVDVLIAALNRLDTLVVADEEVIE